MPRWLYFLLICTMLAPVLALFHAPALLIFAIAGLGILPLAALIGVSVEGLAEHTGERVGGLLFATFGNATELIIGFFALRQGLVSVVSASIIGSILGNVLLVLGISVCVGSFKHGPLTFETRPASQYSSLLALCIGGLLLPTIATLLAYQAHQADITLHEVQLSDFIAIMLLIGYAASILFSVFRLGDGAQMEQQDTLLKPLLGSRSEAAVMRLLAYRQHVAKNVRAGKTDMLATLDSALHAIIEHEQSHQDEAAVSVSVQPAPLSERESAKSPLWRSLLILTLATVGVAWLSEVLVSAIEPVTHVLHWNPAFVGLIFVPLIGGLPEYFNTISMALDKRMGMVLAASAGSSIQIALLMAPLLVLISLFMPQRLDLVFSIIELAVLGLAAFLFSEITHDGELVWLEGLLLVLLYAMMGGTVFLFGS